MKNNPKAIATLIFINEWTKANGFAPSRQEIADHDHNGHLNGASFYLKRLEKDGWIYVTTGKQRAITVSNKGRRAITESRKDKA